MGGKNLAEVTSAVFAILESLSPAERRRVVSATFALLGDDAPSSELSSAPPRSGGRADDFEHAYDEAGFDAKIQKWLRQNNLSSHELGEVFHFSGGRVEIIASELPGESKRERTAQSYLLEGFRAFLETGETKFSDDAAMQLTKRFGAFDTNNHSANRRSLGNNLSGSRHAGFELPQPGLRSAAALVKQMAVPRGREKSSA